MDQMSFQGNSKKTNYFEGWYYKQITVDKKGFFIVIPGISLNEKDSHAFIQVYDSISKTSHYFRFLKEDFITQKDPFELHIKDNIFTKSYMKLNLKEENYQLKGELYYTSHSPLKNTWYAPTIMGPFSYFSMECNHAIISMDHYVDGTIWINKQRMEFEDGYGYMEKDYGTSFPKKYLWFQSNTTKKEVLDHKKMSLVFSIASIPIWKCSFRGFFCVFLIGDKEYRFSTYDGSRIKEFKKKDSNLYQIKLTKKQYELKLVIKSPCSFTLASPKEGTMNQAIKETLNAEATVTLKYKKKVIVKQRMICSGFEDSYFH